MLKTSIALAVAAAAMISATANAADTSFKCSPPVVQLAASATTDTAQYTIKCDGANALTLAPTVTFAGEIQAHSTAPYPVSATYTVDITDVRTRAVGDDGREDQVAVGKLSTSTVSIAALPTQLAAHLAWDSTSNALSIEERPGQWRVFSVRVENAFDSSILEAGVATSPVTDGRASAKLTFGSEFSRFAGKGADAPTLTAKLGLQGDKLEYLLGESAVAAESVVQGALQQLDRQPKSMTRAWALASRAQFLGDEALVRYAEQKVAAHNPQLLEEFQLGLTKIQPFVLPAR